MQDGLEGEHIAVDAEPRNDALGRVGEHAVDPPFVDVADVDLDVRQARVLDAVLQRIGFVAEPRRGSATKH